MKRGPDYLPIFALDASSGFEELLNALQASVEYCHQKWGQFGSWYAFAAMTEPVELDRWVPIPRGTAPEYLVAVSIDRREDKRLLRAFALAEPEIGPLLHDSNTSPVRADMQLPLADVYQQMDEAGVNAYCKLYDHEDDASFFFVVGSDAVIALDKQLQTLTGRAAG